MPFGTAPNLTYTPASDFHGIDVFTFAVSDGQIQSAAVSVAINIVAVNDAPIASSQTLATDEDLSVAVILQAVDVDSDALAYTILTAPAHGTLTGTAPNLTYSPNSYDLPWGGINARFGVLAGNLGPVADNGFHVGLLINGRVFDNNILGLTVESWSLNYEVLRRPNHSPYLTILEADGEGFGQIKVFRTRPPNGPHDAIWNQEGV